MRYIGHVFFVAALAFCCGQRCTLPDTLSNDIGGGSSEDQSLMGINGGNPAARDVPELGGPVSIQIVSQSNIDARLLVRYLVAETESHLADLAVPAMATLEPVGPDLATMVQISGAYADGRRIPVVQLLLGRDFIEGDVKVFVLADPDLADECPLDPEKIEPGICGCGQPDVDTDGDTVLDCEDVCPGDPAKTLPGACGCGEPDIDTDSDGVLDCLDGCPDDMYKTEPGVCGCNQWESDYDQDGTPDCLDECPMDSSKVEPGVCGCFVPDEDMDNDGLKDCMDPDRDGDGILENYDGIGEPGDDSCMAGNSSECDDNCPNRYNPSQMDYDYDGVGAACEIRADFDGDGDVDMDDYSALQSCMTQPSPECYKANFDLDPDCLFDQKDVQAFYHCMTGPDMPVSSYMPDECWGEEVSYPCGI